MLRTCKTCGEDKPFDAYPQKKGTRDPVCKKCMARNKAAYRKTKSGVAAQIYSHQRHSSVKRGHRMPEYGVKEL